MGARLRIPAQPPKKVRMPPTALRTRFANPPRNAFLKPSTTLSECPADALRTRLPNPDTLL
eukprot:10165325-Lingulodinium_polyedra.AAC.1